MNMIFDGWARSVHIHKHPIKPLEKMKKGYTFKAPGPLTWQSPLIAVGKIENLKLSGDFMVHLQFEQEELRNWLISFSTAHPAEALRLVADAQAEAMIALSKATSAS